MIFHFKLSLDVQMLIRIHTWVYQSHLPVNIVASFLKKLARLSLFAPPGAIITIIPFCYNLIKRHPSCMSMLHRQNISTSVNSAQSDGKLYILPPPPFPPMKPMTDHKNIIRSIWR